MWPVVAAAALGGGVAAAVSLPGSWPPLLSLGLAAAVCGAAAAAGAAAALLLALLPRRLLPGLDRRAVLITGCSSGIGKAAALRLDALGVPVIATCRCPAAAGPADLRARASSRLRLLPLDVASDESVRAAAAAVRRLLAEEGLELWALVNNAGVLAVGLTEWLDLSDVRSALETNSLGPIRVTQAFLPLLRRSRGRVVNVLSIACRYSMLCMLPYSMSKYAGLAFTDALRHEMRPFSVAVSSVEPWFYSTPLVDGGIAQLGEVWDKSPSSVKEAYGHRFKDRATKLSGSILSAITYSSSKLYMVTDAIVDACLSENPKASYAPSPRGRLFVFVARHCPWLLDLLLWSATAPLRPPRSPRPAARE